MYTEELLAKYEGIAIVGLSGRFPGARNIDEFWQNLYHGIDAISFFSDEELLASNVQPELLHNPKYVRAKGILEDIEFFDAAFFGYSPKEAAMMDPQQRLFLECAWEVLEQAGYNTDTHQRPIGVYAGQSSSGYLFSNVLADRTFVAEAGMYQITLNNDKDYLATRASYKLNLKGPSMSIQTACSTSLVAVHMACQSLLQYECDMALAGGVSISVPQKRGYLYQEESIASPDGHCRAFDADANGTVDGNGVGIVALKRLADAIADRDTIYAVIRGSAINNDGAAKVGYTAPSVEGQAKVITEAMAMADVEPDTISYVETHGTGTTLGDPIEIAALTQAFRTSTQKCGYCAIGSVKTNIGHLDAAAGIAGLIKTALALKHRVIPPSLHFHHPNPKIDFANSPFYVNTSVTQWKEDSTPRRAGVSSFGIGGTNAHVVLEEAPSIPSQGTAQQQHVVVLSAKSASALETMTKQLATYIKAHPDVHLADIAYTLQTGRKSFLHRRSFVAHDRANMLHLLETRDPHSVLTNSVSPATKQVTFLFPGQGAQYVHMASDLYQTMPAFREQIDHCTAILEPLLGYDLRMLLFPVPLIEKEAKEQLNMTAITQVALFVVEYALAQMLMKFGVQPQAMVGHSLGEYVVACLAGVFSLEDALYLVFLRGKLMQAMPSGSMLAVHLPAEEILSQLHEPLSLAAHNGPAFCTLSGPTEAIASLEASLTKRGIECRHLRTSHAFHSQMMEPVLEPFSREVNKIRLHPPTLPYISNLTGTWITEQEATDPGYWVRHLRQTVRFAESLQELLKADEQILIEVGPGQTLSTFARQCHHSESSHTILPLLPDKHNGASDHVVFVQKLQHLWLNGVPVEWAVLYENERRMRIPLPTYPFKRQLYWIFPERQHHQDNPPMLVGKKPDIADWFSIPSWKRSLLPSVQSLTKQSTCKHCWLVFIDTVGFGSHLIHRLEQQGEMVITVTVGVQFSKVSDRVYTLRPQYRDDYDTLLKEIGTLGMFPTRVIHLWIMIETRQVPSGLKCFEVVQALGFYSLLFLTQALGERKSNQPIQIAVVSNNLQEVIGGEVLCPVRATALGIGKVAPYEYPDITFSNIDIILPESELAQEKLTDQIVAELRANPSDVVIAYRGSHRWVQCIEPVFLEGKDEGKLRLREQGVYLITGGLGGIGLVLAEYLARTVRARLVLIGRTELPTREEWRQRLTTQSEQDTVASKIRKVTRLEELGAEVLVMNADVTDLEQMQMIVAQVCERFGELHGVIHAAGIPGGGMIQLKTPEAAASVLAPKVKGTLVLEAVLKDMHPDFLVLCSSLSSIFGSSGQVDYCAGNTFLDSFAFHNMAQNSVQTISINWDTWQEVGMAVDALTRYNMPSKHRSERQKRLLDGILPQEGVEAFRRIFSHAVFPQVIVSVRDIQTLLRRVERLSQPSQLEVTEQTAVSIAYPRPPLLTAYAAPTNETERTICAIWQQLLGIGSVGIHDNFFDLGGHSLLGTQLITRLRDTFQIDLPLRVLFEEPTVARLAIVIVQNKAELVDDTFLLDTLEDLEQLTHDEAQALLAADRDQTKKIEEI